MPEKEYPIPNYPGYSITRSGVVRSYHIDPDGRKLKPSKDSRGYLAFTMPHAEDGTRHPFLHKLLGLAFIKNPTPETYTVVQFKDLDSSNCTLKNLKWGRKGRLTDAEMVRRKKKQRSKTH
jgi:hypothetical protein